MPREGAGIELCLEGCGRHPDSGQGILTEGGARAEAGNLESTVEHFTTRPRRKFRREFWLHREAEKML